MKNIQLLLIIFLTTIHLITDGQEVLLDLQTIPAKPQTKFSIQTKAILSLPFFDDFAYNSSAPNVNFWDLSGVLINQNYSINAPTIGVATFDAINRKGELYKSISTTTLPADTLTSLPLNLNFPGDTNIYFSFYFQPKGLGKEPQTYDSLVLEFLDIEQDKWIRAWSASVNFESKSITSKDILNGKNKTQYSDTLEKKFFREHFPILDERFKKEGFRFRFMNYASLSPNPTVPGLLGNSDHWNLDLVMVDNDKHYYDTVLNDISFYKPVESVLNNYESIPWRHLNANAKASELTTPYLYFNIYHHNLGPFIWNVTQHFTITDLSFANPLLFLTGGAVNDSAFRKVSFSREYQYDFNSLWEDSAVFLFRSYLITDIDPVTHPRRWNDTISYYQRFDNYYAYDDGSAENGYGLYGEGSNTGMVAAKFHSYELDSLKGIMIYFNRTYQDANEKHFKLTVWDDNDGKPGNIIYQTVGIIPKFTDSLNVFTLYRVEDKIKIGGDFYIGWVQITDDMLNVGFDLNRVQSEKLFYNLTGDWIQSQFNGSLMIRPVFGKLNKVPTNIDKPKQIIKFDIYPNPTSDILNIGLKENIVPVSYRIVNYAGQIILCENFNSNIVDVSNLSPGIYIIQLVNKEGVLSTKKFIISR